MHQNHQSNSFCARTTAFQEYLASFTIFDMQYISFKKAMGILYFISTVTRDTKCFIHVTGKSNKEISRSFLSSVILHNCNHASLITTKLCHHSKHPYLYFLGVFSNLLTFIAKAAKPAIFAFARTFPRDVVTRSVIIAIPTLLPALLSERFVVTLLRKYEENVWSL